MNAYSKSIAVLITSTLNALTACNNNGNPQTAKAMSKRIFFKWALLFVLIINANAMYAQKSSSTSNDLNAQQQSIVAISALTATGDLGNLKIQLNTGWMPGLPSMK